MKPMTFTAGGGQFKIISPEGDGIDFTYRLAGKDTLEIVLGNESTRLSRCED